MSVPSPDVVHIHPGKKDFTVYVLDPLEARHAAMLASSGPAQAGVAIGLGLLSSALSEYDCDISVAGTIVNDGLTEDRLEVVFALREVCGHRHSPPSSCMYPTSDVISYSIHRPNPTNTSSRGPRARPFLLQPRPEQLGHRLDVLNLPTPHHPPNPRLSLAHRRKYPAQQPL